VATASAPVSPTGRRRLIDEKQTVSRICGGCISRLPVALPGKALGATGDEVHRSLEDDDLVPHPMVETTHAITIHAPAAAIWPWLVQMGYHRAGLYTDSWFCWVDK
jgi:hypothetical protein